MTSIGTNGQVEFKFFRPNVNQVCITGDFNGWDLQAIPMSFIGDGWWVASLDLPEGEYRFRYVADGQWHTDYAAHGVEFCKEGWNSVLLVPDRKPLKKSEMENDMKHAA